MKTPPAQHQLGDKDCCVFAIAFAYHAARGDELSSFTFTQAEMHHHSVTCLDNGNLTPFPHLYDLPRYSRKKRADKKIHLYCNCFMPDIWDNMIMCDSCEGWFHFKCIHHLPSKKEEWFCSDCVYIYIYIYTQSHIYICFPMRNRNNEFILCEIKMADLER